MTRNYLASIVGLFAMMIAASAGAGDIAWQPAVDVAAGGGTRGPWRQNDSRYDYVDDPSVAVARDGTVALVWVDQRRKDVLFRRLGANEVRNVSRSPATFSWLPRLALAPGDAKRVYVLWQEIIFSGGSHGGDVLFARSEDGGATFSAPLNLSANSLAGDGKGRISRDVWHNGSLDLAAAVDGAVYVAWTEYEGTLWVAASRDGGRTFARLVRIGDRAPARAPSLAVAPDGAVHLAWTVGEDTSADIRVASSSDGAESFDAPRIVEPSRTYSDAPKIAVDRAGRVHLVWAESSGGPFERYRVRYTRSTDGAHSFPRSRAVSEVGGAFPSLALDAEDGVYVSWELFDHPRHRPRGLGFAFSRDGGGSFTRPGVVPQSADRPGRWNGSFQGLLMKKLAVNAGGAIAVVNSSLEDGNASRVWLIRGQSPNQSWARQPR